MIMSMPMEVYKYMDVRGEKPAIIATAPDSVKEKAREIDKTCIEVSGKPFFSEIREKPSE